MQPLCRKGFSTVGVLKAPYLSAKVRSEESSVERRDPLQPSRCGDEGSRYWKISIREFAPPSMDPTGRERFLDLAECAETGLPPGSPVSLITCQMIRITANAIATPRAASANTVGTTTRAE